MLSSSSSLSPEFMFRHPLFLILFDIPNSIFVSDSLVNESMTHWAHTAEDYVTSPPSTCSLDPFVNESMTHWANTAQDYFTSPSTHQNFHDDLVFIAPGGSGGLLPVQNDHPPPAPSTRVYCLSKLTSDHPPLAPSTLSTNVQHN